MKLYYSKHRAELLAKRAAYRSENRDKISAQNRKYRQERSIECKARDKRYYLKHHKEIKARTTRWVEANPERRREYMLKRQYGIDLEIYLLMLEAQCGKCGICGKGIGSPGSGRRVCGHVDHDHATGKIRGLLCGSCNPGLGYFKNSVLNLEAAIIYLKKNTELS